MPTEPSTPELSVIVPAHNEAGAIRETVETLVATLAEVRCEIIVVDDGSTDATGAILDELADSARIPGLRVVHHLTNQGYGAAIKAGIRRARAELVAITDADGTYPIEAIPSLLEEAREADMVVGARTGSAVVYPFLRRIPKLFLQGYCSWLVGSRIPDMNSGLRIFRRSIFERYFNLIPDGFSLTTTITVAMMRGRYDVRFVPIDLKARVGSSKIRPIRDTLGFVQLILRSGMYFAPLRLLMPLVAVLSAGFLVSLAVDLFVFRNLTDKTVLLLLSAMNTGLFALLADMIDRRS